MPTYSYQCRKCGEILEHFCYVESRDNLYLYCESCGVSGTPAKEFNRILSATQFHLKGPGWGKDGYSKKSDPNAG